MENVVKDAAQYLKYKNNKLQLQRSLEAGVEPLHLKYVQINSCDTNNPIAYRSFAIVNSVVLGHLAPKQYVSAMERTDMGIRLAEWSVEEAFGHINKLIESGKKFKWLSVRCPVRLAMEVDVYAWIKRLMDKHDFKHPEKLCLEFSSDLLRADGRLARRAVLDMKLLGVKTLVSNCGRQSCPTSQFLKVPADMALLAPEITAWTGSRNKPQFINTLIPYINSMRVQVYAAGVENDEQIRLLNRVDCVGYTVANDYKGKQNIIGKLVSFERLLQIENEAEEDSFV